MKSFQSINPTTGSPLETYSFLSGAEVESSLGRSAIAQKKWRQIPINSRAKILEQAADVLEKKKEILSMAMALEMGKPIAQGRAEIEKCALVCRFYSAEGPGWLAPDVRQSSASRSFVRHDPLGTILAVMPWNFPFWQVFRNAAPILLAGNAMVLKHALNVPKCAQLIEEIWLEAGLPNDVFQNLFITHDQIPAIIGHAAVAGITLTGSNAAGEAVAQIAGRYTKPCVMELGGSDPFIVFGDVDLKHVAKNAAEARCLNSGQSCIAAKRFFIHQSIFCEFVDAFSYAMQSHLMGDPSDAKTQIGPQAMEKQQALLEAQVNDAIALGAQVICGGQIPNRQGFFYPPTVLTKVTPKMRVITEEVFGPVAPVFSFETETDVINLANQTIFGLGASVWTNDQSCFERMAGEINAGNIFLNGLVHSDPHLPFGGIKASGFGRELSREGLLSFINIKTIWMR